MSAVFGVVLGGLALSWAFGAGCGWESGQKVVTVLLVLAVAGLFLGGALLAVAA